MVDFASTQQLHIKITGRVSQANGTAISLLDQHGITCPWATIIENKP
jgi:hypothetical protein